MIPVYISLTTIFKNQAILLKTLQSIICQTALPDKIYLFMSEEPFLLDTGFTNKIITNNNLLKFLKRHETTIEIMWVNNQGSYRKLIPLLKQKWNDDCIIITIDDDTVYDNNLIKNLLHDYSRHNCVINYRGFTPKINTINDFDYETRIETVQRHLYNFPTGKGGILYKPSFFKKTGDLIFNENIYMKYCPTGDDIWFYLLRIKNNIDCCILPKKWMISDLTNNGLFCIFNNNNNNNTIMLHNTRIQLESYS